jgi:hypothetical protein
MLYKKDSAEAYRMMKDDADVYSEVLLSLSNFPKALT